MYDQGFDRFGRLVLDRLSHAAFIITDGKIRYLNASAERLIGRPAEQLVGHSFFDLVKKEYPNNSFTVLSDDGPSEDATPLELSECVLTSTLADSGQVAVVAGMFRIGSTHGSPARVLIVCPTATRPQEHPGTQPHREDAWSADLTGQTNVVVEDPFKYVVTAVQSVVDQLLSSEKADRERDHLIRVRQCANELRNLIERVESFDADRHHAAPVLISLKQLLREIVADSQAQVDEPLPRCHLQLVEQGDIEFTGHQEMLRLVLSSLIHHVLDVTADGVSVTLASRRENGQAIVEVITRGTPPELLAQRERAFVKMRDGHLGYGLTMIRRIVERHGASMQIESRPGEEIAITVSVPIQNRGLDRHSRRSGRRFLLVEDNEIIRRTVELLLDARGVDVQSAVDGPSALQMLNEQDFDVVISDLGLPGMNGRDFLQLCREKWPKLQTVLISGWVDQAHDSSSKHAPHITLEKPFSMDDLFRRLESLEE